MRGNNVTVTCWFARGTTARGFKIDILGVENRLVISMFVSINETCVKGCSYSVDVEVGNFTTTVYNWEQDGGIRRVYSREIVIITLKSNSTTESTVITNITDLDPITTVHWGNYTVTSTIIGAGVIGGCSCGAVCCIIFITVTLAVLFKKRRRKSKKSE